ncbi:hypothetical protein HYS84_01060 [Candidatus Saccharibacteria bacterium]|nr:hypothetical protein [Candidatus Saccharibacteria bacterium]
MSEAIKNVGLGGADVEPGPAVPSKAERIRLDLDIWDADRIVEVKRAELAEAERRRNELLDRRKSIYGR